jgi:DNA processing protein
MSDITYWIALSSIKDIGPVRMKCILNHFDSLEAIFRSPVRNLRSVDGIGEKTAHAIRDFHDWTRVEAIIRKCDELGIGILRYGDPSYPALLKNLEDSPFILYTKGDIKEDDRFAVSVVGPRKPTEYGMRVTDIIAGELSNAGFTIVSGMARGIDSAAHKAALMRGGRTIAVLGSGLDIPYPPENVGLMKKIAVNGSVISEYPPGTKPDRENFPKRNRLISGLSLGVLVVEATDDSGALITSRCALEQGREVFAVPGMITSKKSSGTNSLIKDGALLVENANDIIGELAPQLKGFLKERKRKEIPVNEEERTVTKLLSLEPVHIDELTRQSSFPLHKLLGILTALELKGVVKQIEGKKFYLH